jgi:hypothetical protein
MMTANISLLVSSGALESRSAVRGIVAKNAIPTLRCYSKAPPGFARSGWPLRSSAQLAKAHSRRSPAVSQFSKT